MCFFNEVCRVKSPPQLEFGTQFNPQRGITLAYCARSPAESVTRKRYTIAKLMGFQVACWKTLMEQSCIDVKLFRRLQNTVVGIRRQQYSVFIVVHCDLPLDLTGCVKFVDAGTAA